MMWMDYLVAVLVGCVGMLGLYELTADIILLNTDAYEMTLASLILSEAVALSRFGKFEGRLLPEWCANLPAPMGDSHCSSLTEWLSVLTHSQLQMSSEGLTSLQWLSSAGDYLEWTQPL